VLPGEIRQVLSNLVTNAIEASSAGGHLRLRIRCGHQWQGRARVRGLRISVSDNGSGIPEPVRERLGEIFFTTKGQSGTGLGLWVTKAVVTRYAGTLRFKSSTGKRHGTVFTLFLPLEQPVGLASGGELPMQTMAGNRQLESSRDHCGNLRQISDHPSHHDNDPGDAGDAHLGRTQRRNA
jgi:anti-sigma regulatory factor (Ser/Thr protein kinase)